MKRVSILLIYFLSFVSGWSQANYKQTIISLDDQWKFHTGDSLYWAQNEFNDSSWHSISTKQYWEDQGFYNYDGYGWYRKSFVIPAELIPKINESGGLYLKYDYADDVEEIFINGIFVGKMGEFPPNLRIEYGKARKFKIPAQLIRYNSENLIAIRVYDNGGKGGLLSNTFTMNPISVMDDLNLKVKVNSPDWIFLENEKISFNVLQSNIISQPLNFNLICKITTDDYIPVDSLCYSIRCNPYDNFRQNIEVKVSKPGFYRFSLYGVQNGLKSDEIKFNIGYNPEKIISNPDPKPDFDAFWQEALKELKEVTPNFKITFLKNNSNDKKDVYHVSMCSLGNVIIEGYYAVPKDRNKMYPAIITFLGYGGSSSPLNPDNWVGYCEFVLSTRGQGIQLENNKYKDWLTYGLANKENYYYRGAFMDLIRGLDFLSSRPEIDKEKIFAEGGSQGGAFTLAVCALDNRIKAAAPYMPFLSDFPDYFKIAPWPHDVFKTYLKDNPDKDWKYIYDLLSYFDIKNLAGKIKCPIIMGIGLQDNVCPPHINFAGYNQIKSEKKYYVYPDKAHAAGDSWWSVRNDFFIKNGKK